MVKILLFFLVIAHKFCFANDLLISEVLFNPRAGGVDFVEVYNPNPYALSLNGVKIGNLSTQGDIGNFASFGLGTIAAQSYIVISTNTAILLEHYATPATALFIQVPAMPVYNNTSGSVILLRDEVVIDRLNYTERMHLSILRIVKGVSLERVSFNLNADAPGNFTSAAATAGFATPGYKNSVHQQADLRKNTLELEANAFSPDGDGYQDELVIHWKFRDFGYAGTLYIYTDKGLLVKKLISNQNIGTEGTVKWNGLNDKGQRCRFGIYVLKFSGTDNSGKSFNLRKAFGLNGKLNKG